MDNGRDNNGRFANGHTISKGNKGGSGRPKRPVEEKYRNWLIGRVSQQDWIMIVDVAKAKAKAGDYRSRQWLSDWCMGKPIERQEVTGENGGPVVVRWMDDGDPDPVPPA